MKLDFNLILLHHFQLHLFLFAQVHFLLQLLFQLLLFRLRFGQLRLKHVDLLVLNFFDRQILRVFIKEKTLQIKEAIFIPAA